MRETGSSNTKEHIPASTRLRLARKADACETADFGHFHFHGKSFGHTRYQHLDGEFAYKQGISTAQTSEVLVFHNLLPGAQGNLENDSWRLQQI